jgi:hypothetical protein
LRFRCIVSAAVLAGGLLVAPIAVGAADASTTVTAACKYRQSGNHWVCITPGAFCPASAHGKYGYAKVTKPKYKCSFASGDIRWRWHRA